MAVGPAGHLIASRATDPPLGGGRTQLGIQLAPAPTLLLDLERGLESRFMDVRLCDGPDAVVKSDVPRPSAPPRPIHASPC
jgi:hypothetical protein